MAPFYRYIPRGNSINPNGLFSRTTSNTSSSVLPPPPDYLALFLEFSRDDARLDDRPTSSGRSRNWVTGLVGHDGETGKCALVHACASFTNVGTRDSSL